MTAATCIAVVATRNPAVESVMASAVCSAAFARHAMPMTSVKNLSVLVVLRERSLRERHIASGDLGRAARE
jgi:hypothetical protein